MEYILRVLVLSCVYAMLAVSLDLIVGYVGILSLAQAALFGIGAYTSALLAIHWQLGFLSTQFVSIVAAVLVSGLLSLAAFRLKEDYLVIGSFGLQLIVYSGFRNFVWLTNGPDGVGGIPRPRLLFWTIESDGAFFALAVVCLAVSWQLKNMISSSPFGRVLRAIREDETFATSLGKNTMVFKCLAFAFSAGLAGSAGGLYAHYARFIDPSSFTLDESVLLISMVVIGGPASVWGPVAGAFALVAMQEGLRFIGLPASTSAQVRQLLYGALLIVIVATRPKGLVGTYRFGR